MTTYRHGHVMHRVRESGFALAPLQVYADLSGRDRR